MTPEEFIAKWRGVELPEISASQSHFNDLCELLEIGKPIDEDPKGKWFTFEKAVPKGGKAGGGGHADVWRKDCFVWEYKRKNTYNTLAAAIAQARDYAALLDNRLGKGNDRRYNTTVTFETFPFPEGLTPAIPAVECGEDKRAIHIAAVAAKLNELREHWLNPLDLVKHETEVVPGYPDRILPKNQAAAEQLKKRTLTNLYNERPTWLAHAHRDLDRAVAAAYGWPESLPDRAQPENQDAADRKASEEEILKRLFDLNQERAKAGR